MVPISSTNCARITLQPGKLTDGLQSSGTEFQTWLEWMHKFCSRSIIDWGGSADRVVRRKFLQLLSRALIEDHLRDRFGKPTLRRGIKCAITETLGIETQYVPSDTPSSSSDFRGWKCYICKEKFNRRRDKIGNCLYCSRGFCKEHQAKACEQCMSVCGNCDFKNGKLKITRFVKIFIFMLSLLEF